MSESSVRLITIDPIEKGDTPSAVTSVGFEIKPPINVHNPTLLEDALEELGWDNMSGDLPIISSAKINYSDDESTHRVMRVETFTDPEKFQDLVERSFVPAFSLGNKTVELVFKSDAS